MTTKRERVLRFGFSSHFQDDLTREKTELIKLVEELQNSFRTSKEENKKLTGELEEQRERYRLEVMNNSLEWNKYALTYQSAHLSALTKMLTKSCERS